MTIATRPLVYAKVSGDTAEFISIDGNTESLHAAPAEDIRASIVRRAIAEAQVAGSELELVTSGDRGDHRLLIHTDGSVEGVNVGEPVEESAEDATDVATGDVATDSEHPTTRRAARTERRSFITINEETETSPSTGWRALLTRLGITVRPSARHRRRQRRRVSEVRWRRSRAIPKS